MAVIGSLGDIVFSVSTKQVNTINNVKWDSSAQFASHNRHLKDPLLEFTGNDNDKISFTMFFSKYCGVNPLTEMTKILNAERSGAVMRLVIGAKAYGKNKWVITSSSFDMKQLDARGNLLAVGVNISLLAYPGR
ncbi:hypothetical protein FACS18949_13530 [Clostridia bacterium]|nr:hypothetical protein FACS189425_06300 [Clostridia bacterium]GHV35475.1 hypothetical protein FACS18949_13530 [Clostridia bacterium]